MDRTRKPSLRSFALLAALLTSSAQAGVEPQCPGDVNGDAVPDPLLPGGGPNPSFRAGVVCMHLTAGDGYVTMADGRPQYIFGFKDVTGVPASQVMNAGILGATFPAPTIALDEGDEFYLSLTNVGMANRPDLFDPHSVHWHGFPQASAVFDGMPEGGIAINMGATLTYYYRVNEPGTYMYHCHVEATEHMQMGMLGSLYVRPRQDRLPAGTLLGAFVHRAGNRYAYNDGDGSTRYDLDVPLQIGSFDPDFHDASESVQPLPFYLMRDRYPMLNGRGYPDTARAGPMPPNQQNGGQLSQNVSSRIEAVQGQRVLLRISNLNVTRFYTLSVLGLPMKVVGLHAKPLRGPRGADLSYSTGSVTLGGGESLDAILDTALVPPGRYPLYATELSFLNNDTEEYGGMMTELIITAAP